MTDDARAEMLRIATDHPDLTPTAIADALNVAGFRTTQRHGRKIYQRHHVRGVLEIRPAKPAAATTVEAAPRPTTFSTPVSAAAKTPPGVRQDMRALPGSPSGVTTQSKRGAAIALAEEALEKARTLMLEATGDDLAPAVRMFMACLLQYDRLLTSAERGEWQHARTVQQLFIINPLGGHLPDPGGAPPPAPDADPIPAAFYRVVKAYIEESDGVSWDELLERLRGTSDETN